MNRLQSKDWIVLLVAFISILVAFPVLFFTFLHYEDSVYIIGNPLVKDGLGAAPITAYFTSAPEQNWMPLTWLSFATQRELSTSETDAFLFRTVSLSLHFICGVLIYYSFRRFSQKRWLSLAAVLFFCLHPQRVEVVAWVSAQKDLWAACFALISTTAFVHSLKESSRNSRSLLWISVIAFTLSMLSKQTAAALPLVFSLLALRQGIALRKTVAFYAISLAGCVMAWLVNQQSQTLFSGQEFQLEQLLNVPAVYAWHFWRTLWPYGPGLEQSSPSVLFTIAGAALATLTIFLIKMQGWKSPLSLAAASWWILLLPVSGVVPTPLEFTSDRLHYLPSIALSIVALLAFSRCKTLTLCLPILLGLSHIQSDNWRSDLRLFDTVLDHYPKHTVAHTNLGVIAYREENFAEAITSFDSAINGDRPAFRAWQNIIHLHLELSRYQDAYEKGKAFVIEFPKQAESWHLASQASLRAQHYQDSIAQAERAMSLQSRSPKICLQLLRAYKAADQLDKAQAFYETLPPALQLATRTLAERE